MQKTTVRNNKTRLRKLFSFLFSDPQLGSGIIGLSIILFVVIFAKQLANFDPFIYGSDILAKIGEKGHRLGTNHMGQDVYSMIVYGARTSLMVSIISAMISAVLGILIGGVAGFFGGKVDRVISEIINIFMMLPIFFLVLLCRTSFYMLLITLNNFKIDKGIPLII